MIDNLRDAFKDLLVDNDWMDPMTRKMAVKKVRPKFGVSMWRMYAGGQCALSHWLSDVHTQRHSTQRLLQTPDNYSKHDAFQYYRGGHDLESGGRF
jgi:hypothetical protein